ncbi:hypothetical protein ASG52_06240 [Methylobacterium sp. Leaf456]|uniref:hypothetical protein n=1 Tax=Methylobacterium sp. Leaf456 TaxID=1736382 RepID=UPI0006F73E9B|nr:hypothetical protein [Methylobacterium sp. Leaf456]KQT50416.1 hypothetical protein ASG52_06240 [Methylobacterium sp. Leaf456]
MSQSIERNGFLPHTRITVTLLTRTVRSGPATAGPSTRLVLTFLAGLMSLLVVVGLPVDASFAASPLHETAFEQRPTQEPATGQRVERVAHDLEESETHWRLGPAPVGPVPEVAGASGRPCSDATPAGTDHPLIERPPRA